MAAGDLITQNYEVEFNGVLFGGAAANLEVVEFSPFESPDMRTVDLARPLDHGMFLSTDYYGGRTVVLEAETWNTWSGVLNALTALQTYNTELPLVFQLPTVGKLRVNCRVRRRAQMAVNQEFNVGGRTRVIVEFYATDPRIYSNTLQSAVATLTPASSGITFNAVFNLLFGVGTSSTVSVTNAGTFETRPQISIAGPVTDPYLENQTTGKTLSFNGDLASGETLEVDFLNRTVLLNGTASRYSWVDDTDGWWTLQPGVNSIRLGGSTASSATATISWRDAYV